ncbi:hypothetical protein [Desulfogranum marinum]|jgi:hypothetical protein|nr:hypothetical protein [Desulfogranum marinum]
MTDDEQITNPEQALPQNENFGLRAGKRRTPKHAKKFTTGI